MQLLEQHLLVLSGILVEFLMGHKLVVIILKARAKFAKLADNR